MLIVAIIAWGFTGASPDSPTSAKAPSASTIEQGAAATLLSKPPFNQLEAAKSLAVFVPKGTKINELGLLPEGCRQDPDACLAVLRRIEFAAPFLTQLAARPRTLVVGYTDGMSADPAFYVFDSSKSDAKPILEIPGATALYITAEGTIYAIGNGNRFHDVRQKFVLKSGSYIEVQQPLYFVGRTHTVKDSPDGPLVLHLGQAADSPAVATVPPGQIVEVLAAVGSHPGEGSEQWFLMRTEFGLVGYAKCTYGNFSALCGLDLPGD